MYDLGHSLAFPEYSPLPTSFILHLTDIEENEFRQQFRRASKPFRKKVKDFEMRLFDARASIYKWMRPLVFKDSEEQSDLSFSLDTFRIKLAQLLDAKPSAIATPLKKVENRVTRPTIQLWRSRKLLPQSGVLDYDRCAAILIAALIAEKRVRGYLPSIVPEDEPIYCYQCAHPGAPWLPCALPLSSTLPANTLLWLPYHPCDRTWLCLEQRGALRWAGAIQKGDDVQWMFSRKEELQQWNPELLAVSSQFLAIDGWGRKRILHDLADATLLLLASTYDMPDASLYSLEGWKDV
jgi:hypothetical protein